jgi:transposase
VWSVLHVPSSAAEDARHIHRELLTLKTERTRLSNRIKGLLVGQGLGVPSLARGFPDHIDQLRLWDGSPLPTLLHERLLREWGHRTYIHERIAHLERLQAEQLQDASDPAISTVRQLMTLKGIGLQSAWLFTFEFFAWRNIQSRQQITALSGLAPSPYQSGDEAHDLGISKAGSSSVRAMAIQIAWGWIRFQPDSELTRWFERRFAHGGRRMRAIGIVALARRLLIELWRFLQTGALPEGAIAST